MLELYQSGTHFRLQLLSNQAVRHSRPISLLFSAHSDLVSLDSDFRDRSFFMGMGGLVGFGGGGGARKKKWH